MNVNGEDYRTVWMEGLSVYMIEQNQLPFHFSIYRSRDYLDTCRAIRTMIVRGAGAIGAAAGFAMAQAYIQGNRDKDNEFLAKARKDIESTRPTARNLFYAVERVFEAGQEGAEKAVIEAQDLADEDARCSRMIGKYGSDLIRDGYVVETHCNAGWLAFVDYGTALSPVYVAHRQGRKISVLVDETRPRSQGARLTAWELSNEGIPHAVISDNAGAHYMSQGKVDIVIVGADRIAANGDVANKIGTLEKAIAARHYEIPFFVAAPLSTIDLSCGSGKDIVIEERAEDEVLYQSGMDAEGGITRIRVANPGSAALNPAFDITPNSLITGIITEKGIIRPTPEAIQRLFD
ncbi:MAG: S-methyl-5-thioribose-1-phosphate isomerase [Bacteroidales bacterium]